MHTTLVSRGAANRGRLLVGCSPAKYELMYSERCALVCDRNVFVLLMTWHVLICKRNAGFNPWWTHSTKRTSDPSSETAGCMRKTDQFRSVSSTISWQVRRAVPLRNEYATTWLYTYPLSEPYVRIWTLLIFYSIWRILNTPVHSVECNARWTSPT